MKTKETTPPLMYKGFLFKKCLLNPAGIYVNLSTGDYINIAVNANNLDSILRLIEQYKH